LTGRAIPGPPPVWSSGCRRHSALTDCTAQPVGVLPTATLEATFTPFMNQIAVLPLPL
jgi:hypothetical protein